MQKKLSFDGISPHLGRLWTQIGISSVVKNDSPRLASKSYGVEINLPFNSRDDIVWRGHLTSRWIEANNNLVGHFGDVDLTFEVVEY